MSLYARHKGGVYRYLLRQCRQGVAVDELFQDVWMNLIRARASYTPTAKFATYLYRLAHNRLIDHYRASGVVSLVSADDDAHEDAVAACPRARELEPETLAENRQLGERLKGAVASLPPLQRDAFLLQQEAGLSLERNRRADRRGRGNCQEPLALCGKQTARRLVRPS